MKKLILTDDDFRGHVQEICRQISNSGWRPDYIVGITRGGLLPAVMISHYFGVPMRSLNVSLRDGGECVSDCGMAEDAFGYGYRDKLVEDENDVIGVLEAASELLEQGVGYKNILIVDDINDSGATFNWIMNDWQASCLPDDPAWENDIWNENVRFAVVVDNLDSKCRVGMDYVGLEINKAEDDVWVEFPYETWWK